MSIQSDLRIQPCVYWPLTGRDVTGVETYGTPQDILVRWVDMAIEFMDANDMKAVSKARVYTPPGLSLGGYIMLGTAAGAEAHPRDNTGASVIRQVQALLDYDGAGTLHRAVL